jgi:hypothetical protein
MRNTLEKFTFTLFHGQDYSGFREIVDLKRLVIDQRVVENFGDFKIIIQLS